MSEKYKITLLLIAVLSLGTFFISIGNEVTIEKLEVRQASLKDSIRSITIEVIDKELRGIYLEAKYGRVHGQED